MVEPAEARRGYQHYDALRGHISAFATSNKAIDPPPAAQFFW
jgi:hypothetical protein